MSTMTPDHPDWSTLLELIDCGLNPTLNADGDIVSWTPSAGFELAVRAMGELGFSDEEIEDSLAAFREQGAHEDAEILLNLA